MSRSRKFVTVRNLSKRSFRTMTPAERRKEAERIALQPRPEVTNTGVHHLCPPYSGPRTFGLSGPSAVPGSPPEFLVVRDESLIRPFGGFRIFRKEREVARNLSYPDYDCCQRLLRKYVAARPGLNVEVAA